MSFIAENGNESTSTSSSSSQWPQPCRHFEFAEIQLATDNFDESLVIGCGGFGKVYKGTIVYGARPVVAAIKRLDSMSNQGATEFWAEVEMLSKLRNRHLVSLFGYCNHGREMILVYEYIPNGTLEDHLHKLRTPLSWLQRLKICIGAARGLEYLHTGMGIELRVIHRDVKSSNILLHESWEAKISDFGLSRISPKDQPTTHISTKVKGSFGYLDPNYFRTGRLTRKSDVYAFGVVLFEVLCRKRAVDGSPDNEEWGLARWVQESMKEGRLRHIIDSDMRDQISPKCLKGFVQIADRCLHDHPEKRPTIAKVVIALESVLALQEKANTSLQDAGRTIFSRVIDILPFPSKGEYSDRGDSKLSSNSNGDNTSATIPIPSLKIFKFADLKKATRSFGLDMLVGKGGFVDVYLGWVDKNTFAPSSPAVGMPVAVKRRRRKSEQGYVQWLGEVSLLGRLDHPNIVNLLGYCNDKQENLLVCEYMENGSLYDFLLKNAKPLSWRTRLNIMMGVARGLTYLHSFDVQVIHRDVKSSNVFLDQDLNANLGDFGLERSGPGTVSTTTVVRGTLGYLDPEYFRTSCLTVKSDVYGFGVVLLEILTGQHAFSFKRPKEQCNLAMWVCDLAESGELKRGGLEKIMDPCLQQNYPIEAAFECVELALRCVAVERKDRPTSEQALRSLEAISALTNRGDSKLSSNSNGDNTSATIPIPSLKIFKFADLKKATRSFGLDMLVGKGGFVDVYLGWVDKNTFAPSSPAVGMPVAVKRRRRKSEQGYVQWLGEVSLLGRLDHPNIINLLGYCNDKQENLLVCEYMENGSLYDFLLKNAKPLSWRTRLNIMMGVARGLTYLHSFDVQVIHRDVKSSNVFLDQDLNANLGDFGLERSGPGTVSTTTVVRGTLGYLDPEYFRTSCLTVKSDVYGFGVVLLEILTGQHAFSFKRPKEQCNLAMWVCDLAESGELKRGGLEKIMDPCLQQNYPIEAAFDCVELALRCVAVERKDRPTSEQALRSLEAISALTSNV